jgi:competence protein ComEC
MISGYIKNKLEQEYHHLSLWYFISFIFGIIIYFQFFSIKIFYILALAALTLAFIARYFYKTNIILFFLSFCLFSLFIGMIIANFRFESIDITSIERPVITNLEGEVESLKPTLRGVQLQLKVSKNDMGNEIDKVRVNISDKLSSDLSPGDIISLKVKLFPLQESILPGAYDFGFYMRMSGINAGGYALTEPVIISNNSSEFSKYIKLLRMKIYRRLLEVLGKDEGNFAAAILIGETKAIPRVISENMRNSGVAHILSVSGLHLSLVAMIFFVCSRVILNLSNFIAYKTNIKIISAIISILGSFLYLQISGNNIAATRAFIMTSIFIIAIMLGRSPYPLRSVVLAAFLILCFLPEYVFHPSFQLSFAAVLCLISGYEFYLRHKNLLGDSKGVFASIKFYIYANIYSSFLASIITAPFVIYHFYKFANYSVIMNLLAVPLMSFFMMPLALLSVLLMPFGVDYWVLKLLGMFISIVINFAEYIVSLPYAVWYMGHISELSLAIFSFGFFWVCLWQTKWRLIGLIIMFISCVLMAATRSPDFIYDHSLKAVAINDHDEGLKIFSEEKIPKFTADYWASWFGYKEAKLFDDKIKAKDRLYILANGKSVSLNYWNCLDSDIGIITSKKLHCKNNNQIIPNSEIWRSKQVLVYCEDQGKCKTKLRF